MYRKVRKRKRHGVSVALLCALGASVNWRILWNGRSPPCELPVQHVAERAWSESNPLGEASGGEPVSRDEVNSIRPRDADEKTASPPKRVKPATGGETTGAIRHWAFRGGWGQRAGKDSFRKLGDAAEREWQHTQRLAGNK